MRLVLLASFVATTLAVSASALAAAPAGPIGGATAADAGPAPASHAAALADCRCRLKAGTVVAIELAEQVGTKQRKPGDTFALRLAQPLIVDGRTVVPAGAAGLGQVIDAASGGAFGRPAKLILAARYIEHDGVRVPLHALHLGGGGKDNGNLATALSAAPYVGLLAVAIPGGNVEFPAGTQARAKVAVDVSFCPPPTSMPPDSSPAPTPQGKSS